MMRRLSSITSQVGNATVPAGVVFTPPQAFVQNAATFYVDMFSGSCVIESKGITSVLGLTPGDRGFYGILLLADVYTSAIPFSNIVLDLSGNAITNTNDFLAACVNADPNLIAANSKPQIDISGGTSVAPSGQGITDLATLTLAGWNITTN